MKKILTPKFIIIVLFFFLAGFIYILSANHLDKKVDDISVKFITLLTKKKSSDDIVLVVIDNKSLDKINWPWKKDLFTDIYNFLKYESNAKVVVFQNLILFPDTFNPDNDNRFFSSLKSQKDSLYSYIFLNSNIAGDVLPSEYIKQFDTKININIRDMRKNKNKSTYRGIVRLPKLFLDNVNNLAFSSFPEDIDEMVRNYMPIVKYNDKLYPSLALSAFSMYKGINSYVLFDNFLCSDDNCQSLKLPIDYKKGRDYIGNTYYGIHSIINWYKPTSKYYSHKFYSAVDVLQAFDDIKNNRKPKISLDSFKDKIVIIGLNADENSWEQLSATPVLKKQADIDVHATMISNLLKNSFKTNSDVNYTFLITFIFSAFVLRGFRKFSINIIFTTILSLIYFIYYLYQYFEGIYIPPVTPIITMYSIAVFKNIYEFISTDKNAEMMKHALGKYVSKDVMKKVISDLDKLKVGGIRAVVTILFVDIRNFTQISENLSPQEVSSILNEYFSTIAPVIGKYNGIVNKYMGDGLLAIFGDPIKTTNHALNAVKCGDEIVECVKILREKLINEGKPKINIGIGINTGEVFAGNIGTEERLEYTVIGDNVNLAYRIESYNQILKTQFLISEYTYEFVKDSVDVVKLSAVNIKGKSKPIDIYEILRIKK